MHTFFLHPRLLTIQQLTWNLFITLFLSFQIDIAIQAFHSEDPGKDDTTHYDLDDEDDGIEENNASPKAVGHNIYILAHQVCCVPLASQCQVIPISWVAEGARSRPGFAHAKNLWHTNIVQFIHRLNPQPDSHCQHGRASQRREVPELVLHNPLVF